MTATTEPTTIGVRTPRDLIPEDAAIRVRVLIGDDDAQLRKGKKAIAFSDCTFPALAPKVAARCVVALRESDARLRVRHDNYMLWSWNSTWWRRTRTGP